MKFATKPISHSHRPPHRRDVATIPWEIMNSNFCRYSAIIPDIEENANKLHIKCADFNSSRRVTAYAECIYVFLLKSCPNH